MINIVLPVDFSDATDRLIDGAVKFAKETKGKICLIHVAPADIGFAIGDMGFQYFPEVEQNEIKDELLRLNVIEQRIIAQDVDCEHLLK
ncbi:MAG TPA: universal stress protein, partial [Chryseobacterium sp.]|nr:universal stress protein [Chryseobacterium sp.]